jgi:hypothetical protein
MTDQTPDQTAPVSDGWAYDPNRFAHVHTSGAAAVRMAQGGASGEAEWALRRADGTVAGRVAGSKLEVALGNVSEWGWVPCAPMTPPAPTPKAPKKECCGNCGNKTGGRFQRIGTEVGALVEKKNAAYGDAFAKSGAIMRVLYPDGCTPAQMDDFLAVTRVVDKLFRVATRRDAFGESPGRDIAGYGILLAARHEAEAEVGAAAADDPRR